MNSLNKIYKECPDRCIRIVIMAFIFISILASVGWNYGQIITYHLYGNISSDVQYYNDSSDALTLHDLLKADHLFQTPDKNYVNSQLSYTTTWVKIPKELLLLSSDEKPFILSLDAYTFKDISGYYMDHKNQMVQVAFDQRSSLFPHLQVNQTIHMKSDLYVPVVNILGSFRVHQSSVDGYYLYMTYLNIFILFAIGILFATYVMDIVLSFIFREKYFALFAVYQNFVMLYIYYASGVANMFFDVNEIWYTLVSYLLALFSLTFIYFYLGLRERMPKMARFYRILFVLVIVLGIVTPLSILIPSLYRVLFVVTTFVLFFAAMWSIITIILYHKSQYHISEFFLIGALLQGILIILLMAGNIGTLEDSIIYIISFIMTSTINGVLFTIGILYQLRDVKEKNELFYKLATTDKLTGAYNRYYFEKILTEAVQKNHVDQNNLILAIFDIDHFKSVNDQYGHDVGDLVLKEMVSIMRKSIRDMDPLFRWGGEEFAILFLDLEPKACVDICERIRVKVSQHDFSQVGHITISAGIGQYHQGEATEKWFKHTDLALYTAKKSGRNCLKVYEEV